MLRSRKPRPMRLTNTHKSVRRILQSCKIPSSGEFRAKSCRRGFAIFNSVYKLMSAPQSEIIWDHLRSYQESYRNDFLTPKTPCHCWTRHQDLQIIMVGQQSVTEMQYSWTSPGLKFPWKKSSETETGPRYRLGPRRLGMGPAVTRSQIFGTGDDIWDVPRCPSCSLLHIMAWNMLNNGIKPIDMVCRHPLETSRGTLCARMYEVVDLKWIKDMQEMARDHDDHAPLLQGVPYVPSCGQVVYHLLSLLRWYWVRLTVTMDPDWGSNSDIRHVKRSDIFPFKFLQTFWTELRRRRDFLGDPKIMADTLNELPWRLQSMDWQWFREVQMASYRSTPILVGQSPILDAYKNI